MYVCSVELVSFVILYMYCIPVLYVCIIYSSVEEQHCQTLELKIINQSINQSINPQPKDDKILRRCQHSTQGVK